MTYVYDAIYRLTNAKGREHAGLIGDDQRDERDLPINNLPHANDMSAVRRYEETYEYDLVGNFESFAHVAVGNAGATWTRLYDYGVGKPNNRLQTNSLPGDTTAPYTAAYTYDDHGNVTSMPHLATIDWDPSDQMQRADLGGGGEVFFTYDAAGQRVRKYRKHIGTLVEERVYLGAFELYRRRLSGTLQVERETLHVMDGVRRVAMIETKTVDTAVVGLVPTPRFRFQLGNHLETAHLEVDDTGLVISYEEMHPYGTSAYRSAASAVEVSARRYRYTGKERDDETGLDYFGARYYASWLGRWVSADPLGVQAGINLYLYCRAGPVVLVDPDGREDAAARLNQLSQALWGSDNASGSAGQTETEQQLLSRTLREREGQGTAAPDPFREIARNRPSVSAAGDPRSQAMIEEDEGTEGIYEGAFGFGTTQEAANALADPAAIGKIALASLNPLGPLLGVFDTAKNVGSSAAKAQDADLTEAERRRAGGNFWGGVGSLAAQLTPFAALAEGRVVAAESQATREFAATKGRVYVPDVASRATGRTSLVRAETIADVAEKELSGVRFTFQPEYNPFLEQLGVAEHGAGSQLGPRAFSSRTQVIETMVHEELHHRWWNRGEFRPHHATPSLDARFESIVSRFMSIKGFR